MSANARSLVSAADWSDADIDRIAEEERETVRTGLE
jgi:hypothetical protein